jgi:hypothetical protein
MPHRLHHVQIIAPPRLGAAARGPLVALLARGVDP